MSVSRHRTSGSSTSRQDARRPAEIVFDGDSEPPEATASSEPQPSEDLELDDPAAFDDLALSEEHLSSDLRLPVRRSDVTHLPVPVVDEDVGQKLDLLQKYFREIRRHRVLEKEEEHALAVELVKHQDPKIAFKLITANLRLVVKIAMEYQSAVANLLDLIQEGNIGLMQAVKKFDPYKGIRLSSYAQWWIRAYILKYLVNNARMVKVGTTQAQRKLFFNLRKEKERLEALGFKPEPALLAQRLDVRVEEVNEMEQRLSRSDISLDAPLGDDQKSKVSDLMASTDADAEELVIEREFHQRIRYFMDLFAKDLKDRERILWDLRLTADEPLTLQEIGDKFGVTRERARQIEKEITKRFRDFLQKHMPDLDASDLLPH